MATIHRTPSRRDEPPSQRCGRGVMAPTTHPAPKISTTLRLLLALGLGLVLVHRLRRRRPRHLRCGFCHQHLGTVTELKDPYRYAMTAAHLGICPKAPRPVRRSVADLVPEDSGVMDWARLRADLATVGYLGGPHANPLTIHPAGKCAMCDAYADLQARGHR